MLKQYEGNVDVSFGGQLFYFIIIIFIIVFINILIFIVSLWRFFLIQVLCKCISLGKGADNKVILLSAPFFQEL